MKLSYVPVFTIVIAILMLEIVFTKLFALF